MIFVEGETKHTTRNIPTPKADRARFCLTDEDVLELAGYACTIEAHYGRPMDIEWAKDGLDGKLYIVQARPETVASQHSATALESYVLEGRGEVLAEGRSVGEKIASGAVIRIENLTQLAEFKPGEVLVADTTTPDWEPVMKTAAAIVTNRGGRTCHAADHRPRARRSRRRRRRRRDHLRARWRRRDGLVRRRRHRAASTAGRSASTSTEPRWRISRGREPRS